MVLINLYVYTSNIQVVVYCISRKLEIRFSHINQHISAISADLKFDHLILRVGLGFDNSGKILDSI